MTRLQPKQDTTDIGVIIGRFQVHELHEGHVALLEGVAARHEKLIVILGVSPLAVSRRNPLDFQSREQMIRTVIPNAIVVAASDMAMDTRWSENIDSIIGLHSSPGQTATLYGGRDSFIKHYHGRFPTIEMSHEEERFFSGDQIRERLRKSVIDEMAFRAGVIWASQNQYPKIVSTVDVAVMNEEGNKVLMARKPREEKYRFIGGFTEVGSPSDEADARREVEEEAHIAITDPEYVGSYRIDDWRFRGEADEIRTRFFVAKHMFGKPTPDDDIEELRWFDIYNEDMRDIFVEEHRPLMVALYKLNGINTAGIER